MILYLMVFVVNIYVLINIFIVCFIYLQMNFDDIRFLHIMIIILLKSKVCAIQGV